MKDNSEENSTIRSNSFKYNLRNRIFYYIEELPKDINDKNYKSLSVMIVFFLYF